MHAQHVACVFFGLAFLSFRVHGQKDKEIWVKPMELDTEEEENLKVGLWETLKVWIDRKVVFSWQMCEQILGFQDVISI